MLCVFCVIQGASEPGFVLGRVGVVEGVGMKLNQGPEQVNVWVVGKDVVRRLRVAQSQWF